MHACQIPSREKRSEARNLTRFAAPCCQNSVNLRPASRLRRAHCHAHSQPAPCEGTSFRRFRTRRRCVPSFTLPSHWASENAHDVAPAYRQRAACNCGCRFAGGKSHRGAMPSARPRSESRLSRSSPYRNCSAAPSMRPFGGASPAFSHGDGCSAHSYGRPDFPCEAGSSPQPMTASLAAGWPNLIRT